jgi:hypothetical protein
MGFLAALGIASCESKPGSDSRYLDLNTGATIELTEDSLTGERINTSTGKPVDLYVDRQTKDTLSGRTGEIVNGRVAKTSEGLWVIKTDGDEFKAESEYGAKIKMEDGESKLKDGNYTRKVDADGDVKIETGNKTIKIDGETGEKKVKKDKNTTDKVKKVFN